MGSVLVFGEPYEAGSGAVIVTVSRKSWFDSVEHPVGLYVVTADGATWTPAVDSSRHMLIGVCTGFVAAAVATAAVLRRPPWPDLNAPVMVALARGKDSVSRR